MKQHLRSRLVTSDRIPKDFHFERQVLFSLSGTKHANFCKKNVVRYAVGSLSFIHWHIHKHMNKLCCHSLHHLWHFRFWDKSELAPLFLQRGMLLNPNTIVNIVHTVQVKSSMHRCILYLRTVFSIVIRWWCFSVRWAISHENLQKK